jgi:hypothetical protein
MNVLIVNCPLSSPVDCGISKIHELALLFDKYKDIDHLLHVKGHVISSVLDEHATLEVLILNTLTSDYIESCDKTPT